MEESLGLARAQGAGEHSPRRAAAPPAPAAEDAAAAVSSAAPAAAAAPWLPPWLANHGLSRGRAARAPALLAAESDEGFVEYKRQLSLPPPGARGGERFQRLVTQLQWRLSEGGGACVYCIGVEDDGTPRGLPADELAASLAALDALAAEVGAAAALAASPPGDAPGHRCAVVRVARGAAAGGPPPAADVRVALGGAAGAGKSSLAGVLSRGASGAPALDDGRGAARAGVLRHAHEQTSGRTSAAVHVHLAYGAAGRPRHYGRAGGGEAPPAGCARGAARAVRLTDLGGAAHAAKGALRALAGAAPGYIALCACAGAGPAPAARDHLAAALALGVAPFALATRADLAPAGAEAALARELVALVEAGRRAAGVASSAPPIVLVRSPAEASAAAAALGAARAAGVAAPLPLLSVSAVTGAGLDTLHAFLAALPPAYEPGAADAARIDSQEDAAALPPARFQIDDAFDIAGAGRVVGGALLTGRLRVGDTLLLGPADDGSFGAVQVAGARRGRAEVSVVERGQHATLALRAAAAPGAAAAASGGCPWALARAHSSGAPPEPESEPLPAARRGAVLVAPAAAPRPALEFEALLVLFDAPPDSRAAEGGSASGSEAEVPAPATPPAPPSATAARLGRAAARPPALSFVIHCGGVRQAARIMELEELPAGAAPTEHAPALAAARAAAGVLGGGGRAVRARLRFAQRAEWLLPKARLVLRGGGRVAGAGVVVEGGMGNACSQ
jgi:GTPase